MRLITFWARTLSVATIRNYLSMGVRVWHIENGIEYTAAQERMPVDAALTGVRRAKGDTPAHRKLPITLDLLRKMRAQLDMNDQSHLAFWAAATTAFFCMLRKGNITATSKRGIAGGDRQAARRKDLATSEDGEEYQLTLNATKTIQFQERTVVLSLPALPDPAICPTRAMHAYLASRGPMGPDELLMQVREPAGTAGGEPHWGPLTYTAFLAQTKTAIRKAGVDPDKYAGHGYRRGGATWAMSIGIPTPAIKAIGRTGNPRHTSCTARSRRKRAGPQPSKWPRPSGCSWALPQRPAEPTGPGQVEQHDNTGTATSSSHTLPTGGEGQPWAQPTGGRGTDRQTPLIRTDGESGCCSHRTNARARGCGLAAPTGRGGPRTRARRTDQILSNAQRGGHRLPDA